MENLQWKSYRGRLRPDAFDNAIFAMIRSCFSSGILVAVALFQSGCQPSKGVFNIENIGTHKIENLEIKVSGTIFNFKAIDVGEKVVQKFAVIGDSGFHFRYTISEKTVKVGDQGYVTSGIDQEYFFQISDERVSLTDVNSTSGMP